MPLEMPMNVRWLATSFRGFARATGRLIWDFRITLLTTSAVLGLCAVTQIAVGVGIVARDQLAASRTNPVGVFTSVFAHWDATRFLSNTSTLLLYTALFIFSSYRLTRAERKRR